MNAGIAFLSRKSRKQTSAWRYAIAVVLVVCCIGLAYVEIVVAPWFINEVVVLCFRRPRCLKNRPCSGNGDSARRSGDFAVHGGQIGGTGASVGSKQLDCWI